MVIIVHGLGEHTGRYSWLAEQLNKSHLGVIGVDHYGHGRSDGNRGASLGSQMTEEYLHAFLTFVRFTYPCRQILYGHSMGGNLVAGLLLRRMPYLKGAILSSPALAIPSMTAAKRRLLRVLYTLLPDIRIAQGLDIRKLSHDEQVVREFCSDPLNHDRMSIRLAWDMYTNGLWCQEHARFLAVPVLLYHGAADKFTGIEGSRIFAANAPNELMTYLEWPGGYHELHNEPFKNEVVATITEWANAHLPSYS